MSQPAPAPANAYPTIPMQGVVEEGPIRLVAASSVNQMVQIIGAIIGALGGAILGAGLGPLVTAGNTIPAEATQAIAQKCVADIARCESLNFATKHTGLPLSVIGVSLLVLQVVMIWRTQPKKK